MMMIVVAIDISLPDPDWRKRCCAVLHAVATVSVSGRAAGNGLGALAAFSFRVNLLAHLYRYKPLHVSDVGKRPCQISVLRVPLLEVLDGAGEKFQCFLVMSLPPDHAAMSGIDVAQRNVVVAVAERRFSMIQNARRFAELPFLE